jgi:hypothetical protein
MTVGILLLIGESFRTGEQGTRIRGIKSSYEEQMKACKSHIQFMNHFSNIKWKVVILSYTTPYDKDLNELYKPFYSYYYDSPIGYDNLFNVSKQFVIMNQLKYDFLFVSRIDLYFKPNLSKIFNPSWTTIHYPFICWKKGSVSKKYYPRVSDTMVFIPKKYNLSSLSLNHDSWAELCNNGFGYSDIDVMINTYHDSDSSKDYNPLYTIVNRHETNIWDSPNDIFNKKQQFIESHRLFLAVGPTHYIISPYW